MIWSMIFSCSGKSLDFGKDTPTDLSGEIDHDSIHPNCIGPDQLIKSTPEEGDFEDFLERDFSRYVSVVAPNGSVIPIFAQEQVSDAQLVRARNLLRFFLTDAPGTRRGEDKSQVANSMANNGAVLVMPNGAHEEGNEPRLDAQPLYAAETPVEGHAWFMNSNYNHRDAAFEEIFHLVHDTGIGTYLPGALPDYQAELDSEARAAIEDGRWGIPVDPFVSEWLEELAQEDSLAQEYIASVIDSYYGLWGAWQEAPGGMWGVYIAKTREEIALLDAPGQVLLRDFLPEYISTPFRLHPDLNTAFDMQFDQDLEYTHRSQYFESLTLTGTNPSGLFGNALDNTLQGNVSNNVLNGRSGENTVVYCENASSYTVTGTRQDAFVNGPDGADQLLNVEWIHFADGRVSLESLLSN